MCRRDDLSGDFWHITGSQPSARVVGCRYCTAKPIRAYSSSSYRACELFACSTRDPSR